MGAEGIKPMINKNKSDTDTNDGNADTEDRGEKTDPSQRASVASVSINTEDDEGDRATESQPR